MRSAAACVFAQPGRKQQRDLPIDCVCVCVCVCLSMMKRTVFFGGGAATTLYIFISE